MKDHYPAVAESLSWLAQYGKARMTGTGACVFVDVNSQQQAQKIMDDLPESWQGFVAKGCNISPLNLHLTEDFKKKKS